MEVYCMNIRTYLYLKFILTREFLPINTTRKRVIFRTVPKSTTLAYKTVRKPVPKIYVRLLGVVYLSGQI